MKEKICPLKICGVDEAGRGPLAGSVFAAAVILPTDTQIIGLTDSKKLSACKRDQLARQIKSVAIAYHIAHACVTEIDTMNILQATFLAMKRAVSGLNIVPSEVLVDGNQCPQWTYASRAIIKGDSKVAAISAASILAKVSKDAEAIELASQYPEYGFEQHKGYGTALHIQAIKDYGPCPAHRKSFGIVKTIYSKLKFEEKFS